MSTNNPSLPAPSAVDATKLFDSLDVDIAQISLLMSEYNVDVGGDETDISELLKRLESANGMADGVESKLDGILGNLDELLELLEPKNQDTHTTTQVASVDN
ncbi:hypothetical protein AMATHDRAFT_48505 [Amanita thiersii Skay4041]|uniref:Uncharacterized protein n=1 Tax=Amanita thiersii Skay4041 TaxID=703135 RepID=A0A2A9NPQ5_9AGAR|nr:hypothetical protein AMATHDRAFT_48505 [Amanita thiersii Skay4041]